MPITRSAKKALRQNRRRYAANLRRKKELKAIIKNFRRNPNANELPVIYKKLDKTAKINLIKKNKAARLKSQLAQLTAKSVKTVS